MPIAHGEGNYYAEPDVVDQLEANRQVVFRYTNPDGEVTMDDNPNGSINNIAGICNQRRNVVGLMPHPERAAEAVGRQRRWPRRAGVGGESDVTCGGDFHTMSVIDTTVLERHGIKPDEYDRIVQLMGREPNLLELGLFSVMWSEHCSYKSSRVHLKTLPTTGPRVVQGPGENAGAVDIGDGLCAVFKIESHNHPSFIEPYQGAATGVGGIIRDIFTMGARPIALLNALRFGSLETALARRIFEGVVAASAATATASAFRPPAAKSCSTRCMPAIRWSTCFCLGISRIDGIVKGAARGTGNPVFYVGAKTGRDGIHGATMASAEFDEKSAEKRPAVQVGDPFMEKLLMEACLEVMKTGAVVGIQDMGAAGLTCSTSEMGSRGGCGMTIDVMHVPQRETGMTPYEIMLSESQERMLLVVEKGREHEVEAVFEKWDLHAVADRRSHRRPSAQGLRTRHAGRRRAQSRVDRRSAGLSPADARARVAEGRAGALDSTIWAAAPAAQAAFDRLIAHADDREQAVGVSPVRPQRRHQHDRPTRNVRGGRSRQGHVARAGAVGGWQRPILLSRSVSRRDARGRRSGAQRRVRRRHADRRHQQSELRQSRTARDHVAVR